MDIKGLRHLPTLQRLANRLAPRSPEGALAELTHLEHERARFERELKSLAHNQQQTEHHLRQVQARIALLERVRCEARDDPLSASGDNGSGSGGPDSAGRREIPLEY